MLHASREFQAYMTDINENRNTSVKYQIKHVQSTGRRAWLVSRLRFTNTLHTDIQLSTQKSEPSDFFVFRSVFIVWLQTSAGCGDVLVIRNCVGQRQ